MSCGSKGEDRKQREGRRRFNGSLESRTVRERERETETSIQKTLTQYINLHVCVFNAHFYTSPYKDWQKYYRTSMLLKSAYTNSKIYSSRNIFICVTDRSQPTRYSASPIGPYRLGPRLLQPTRPMLSLYLNTILLTSYGWAFAKGYYFISWISYSCNEW